ncbi:hypothetical protein MNB_SUP05-5-21 [hydrothermal vent metagenome]|uniref:DUF302 domain-containing protein n=1 Tax=hydrothermal vent metagenome TaxID=652676 RepID=A0A1W1CTK3_9ZZZZ
MKYIKTFLLLIGILATFLMGYSQYKYNLITKMVMAPALHEKALDIYMNMAVRLFETGDITMASIRRVKVNKDVSIGDIEEAMHNAAIDLNIKEVGTLPLSQEVENQTGKKQKFLKIYQYCVPTTAITMVAYSDAFSAYLPCRIALVEAKDGTKWLYTLDMDLMIYGGAPLPKKLNKLALQVQKTIYAIQNAGANGDYDPDSEE